MQYACCNNGDFCIEMAAACIAGYYNAIMQYSCVIPVFTWLHINGYFSG